MRAVTKFGVLLTPHGRLPMAGQPSSLAVGAVSRMMLRLLVLAALLSLLPGSAAAASRRSLQARAGSACPCEQCVDVLGQSLADCQALGLDCSCLLDCKY